MNMQQHVVKSLDIPISYTGDDNEAVSFPFHDKVEKATKLEAVKRKVSQQHMLDSLFDSTTGECHIHSDELMDMIRSEYQCNMVEIASGNGSAQNVYNDDEGCYTTYLSADGHEASEHNRNGIADSLIDGYEGIHDKNISEIPSYQVVTDDSGQPLRLDDMACMICVTDSNYSLWDTIHDKGQLIVRHLSNWYGKGCQFKKEGYSKREARRLNKKHNKLMGMTTDNIVIDGVLQNGSVRSIEVKRLNKAKVGNRDLSRLVKNARQYESTTNVFKDELAKLGYNYY